MGLSSEQIESVRRWLSDGADVAQVQTRLQNEFGISMRYIDVRFLIDDIGAQINIPEPQEAAAPAESASPSGSEGEGQVFVAMDPTPNAGTLASGTVVFSDGGKAQWFLDNTGRLGLLPETEGYNAPQNDLPIFQQKLQELLSSDNSQQSDSNAGMEPKAQGDSFSDSPSEGGVEVTISKIQRPDCLAFGDVKFSDGSKAEWRIDRLGQLALVPAVEGQKPPQSDMPEFQRKLQDVLKTLY